jgi:hypothetical protein
MHFPVRNILIFAGIFIFQTSGYAQRAKILKEINRIIRYESDDLSDTHSGLGIAVIDKDSLFQYFIGMMGQQDTRLMDSSTLFPAGGVTHLVTDLQLIREFRKGTLHQDSLLGKYLPASGYYGNITLRDLMAHRSGLPVILPGMSHLRSNSLQPYAALTRDSICKYLNRWFESHQSLQKSYQHSQYNYFLLSLLFENKPDELVAPYLTHGNKASFKPSTTDLTHVPQLYNIDGLRSVPLDYAGFSYTMGLYANLGFLSAVAFDCLHQFKDDPVLFGINKNKQGEETYISTAGFRINKEKKSWVYMMTGNSKISTCIVLLCPATQTGVVVTGNSGFSLHLFAMDILRMINFDWKRK